MGVDDAERHVTDLLAVINRCGVVADLFGVVADLFGVENVLIRGLAPGLEPLAILPPDIGG